ncbi:MAG TPA: PQQ-binding-like beta-propeller repeat protein [Planctomycetota bacterium]|nr:PQQ-binding-like beta-propeller repeat protein [Planctomycetota bacterium]
MRSTVGLSWPFGAGVALAALLAVRGAAGAASGEATAAGADWPQFRGPNRDGVSTEQGWLEKWPESGPTVVWRANVGTGYSGVAISGGQLFTMGHTKQSAADGSKEDFDQVWCLDAATGAIVWKHTYRCPVASYYGPFTTPAVDAGLVISLSQFGHLHCLERSSGKVVWAKNVVADLHGKKPYYGYACSPLVVGDLVVVEAGGPEASLVALHKRTGQVAWRYGKGEAGYSTPTSCMLDGKACVVALTPAAVSCVDAATGQEIWRHPWNASPQSSATAPLAHGEHVFVSASESKQTGLLLRVARGTTSVVWQNRNMMNYFNASVVHQGYVYGIHSLDHIPKNSLLRCVNLLTAEVKWEKDGVGLGGLILAGGRLLVLTDKGEFVVAEAAPEAYKEIGRAKVLDGNCWNAPVLCRGKIYCRNHRGDIVCLVLR